MKTVDTLIAAKTSDYLRALRNGRDVTGIMVELKDLVEVWERLRLDNPESRTHPTGETFNLNYAPAFLPGDG